MKKPLTAEESTNIATRYANGESLLSLMQFYHRSKPVIKIAIINHGGTIRPRGVPHGYEWSESAREQHHLACQEPEFREQLRNIMRRLHETGVL
jgi:hypothetical protein